MKKKICYLMFIVLSVFCFKIVNAEEQVYNSYYRVENNNRSYYSVEIINDNEMLLTEKEGIWHPNLLKWDRETQYKATYTINGGVLNYNLVAAKINIANGINVNEDWQICDECTYIFSPVFDGKFSLNSVQDYIATIHENGDYNLIFLKSSEKNDSNWINFTDKFISKIFNYVENIGMSYDDYQLVISSDQWGGAQLVLNYSFKGNSPMHIELRLEDNILTRLRSVSSDEDLEYAIDKYAIEAFSEIHNYNFKNVIDYLEYSNNLNILNDGISYAKTDGQVELKFNLNKGLSNYDNNLVYANYANKPSEKLDNKVETKVENPKTGIYVTIGTLAGISLVVGSLTYIKTRRKSRFPQI